MTASQTASSQGELVSRRAGLLVFLAVLLLSVPQAALLPLLDRDEPRFAEASREMLQSGNFIVPTFNGAPRYAKPPLIYWTQAACFTVLGEDSFSARLPSLLATAGTALLLFLWGAQLGSAQAGLAAGLAYAFCLQTIQQGRVATADALLIFFMTLTVFAGWKVITAEHKSHAMRSYFWDTLLALGFAGGFLAKGPEAFLPLLPMLVCARGIRKGLIGELLVNFIIGAIIVLFWAVPAYVMTHGDYWRIGLSEGVGDRAISSLQGHGASSALGYIVWLPYYLVLFWVSALPWSPLILAKRKSLFAQGKPLPIDSYLLFNAALIFLVFTLLVTKLPHYTLPAFPFLTLALTRRWESAGLSAARLAALCWATGFFFAILTIIFVPIALANHATPSPTGELVREAGPVLTPDTKFALVDFQEPNAIWEMRRVSRSDGDFIPESNVVSYLNQPGAHAVVLSTALWQKLNLPADPSWKIFEARGWNTAKAWDSKKGTFATIDLTLVVKPSP